MFRVIEQGIRDAGAEQHLGISAEAARQREGAIQFRLTLGSDRADGLHGDNAPRRVAALGDAPVGAHQVFGGAQVVDGDQHAPAQRDAGQAACGLRFA